MKAGVVIVAMSLCGSVFSQEKEHLQGSTQQSESQNEIKNVAGMRRELEVAIYPNPTQGKFVIEAKEGASVAIYSSNGTYVGTWIVGSDGKLTIEDLPQGSFVCSIVIGEIRSIKKLVIL